MDKTLRCNTLEDFPSLRGATVILRVDVNSPVDPKSKKVLANPRIAAHAKTIALLCKKGAKVVILAHQGRKGDPDCLPLAQHALLLSKAAGIKIAFSADPHVVSERSLEAVVRLKSGSALLLDNVRFLDEETASKPPEELARGLLVGRLAPHAQLYVDDAFSNAHRAHASIVGFPKVLASAAGPVMVSELEGALSARNPARRPSVYVLGGAKPEEVLGVMKYALEHAVADKILTCGVFGELCVIARGSSLSSEKMAFLREHGQMQHLLALREIIHKFNEFIETPFDFALKDSETGKRREVFLTMLHNETVPSGDIGEKTARKYAKIVARSKTIYVKGPAGMYEDPLFEHGTRTIFTAVANNAGATTLVAGGNTLNAFEKLNIPTDKITFKSLGGGVLMNVLEGKELPAIVALQESAKQFGTTLGFHELPAAKPVPVPKPAGPKPVRPSTKPPSRKAPALRPSKAMARSAKTNRPKAAPRPIRRKSPRSSKKPSHPAKKNKKRR